MKDKTQVFNAYSLYYDLLYRDKDYAGETEYIHAILSKYGVVKGELLEFGSGTGKHGRLLVEAGYKVHGIERSAEMVAQATVIDGFTCQVGDICSVNMGRTYDAVLSLFHVVSYQISNECVHAVFSRAAEHLEEGGLFVFDVWYTPAVYSQHPLVRVKRMVDKDVEVTRIAEPTIFVNENRVDVNYTIYATDRASKSVQMFTETHPMRHFSLPEIDFIAEVNGFQRIAAEEFLTGKRADEDTWGVCVILRKT